MGIIFSKLISEPASSSQVDLHWVSPHLPWRVQRICGLFFRIYLCPSRDFVNQHVFLLFDLHWDSPKLPWGIQRICGPFVLKTIIMPFKRSDSLFCDTRSLDLCILFKFIFLDLYYIPPHSCALFTHFTLHQFFSYVYYHAKYFSYPWWRCCSEFNYYF